MIEFKDDRFQVPVVKRTDKHGEHLQALASVRDVYALTGEIKKKASQEVVKHDASLESFEYASWGADNMTPTKFRKKLSKSPVAQRALNKLVRMDYGNGPVYFKTEDLQKGGKVTRHYDPRVEEFHRRNRIDDLFLPHTIINRRWHWNNFGEFILNMTGDQIVGVRSLTSEYCRVAKQDPKTLTRDWLYYSEYFINGIASSDLTSLLLLLPQFEQEQFILDHKSFGKFGYHNFIPSPGMTYYAEHPAESLTRTNGYADVSIAVPEIVNTMMNNQVSLAYMIYIPISYFEARYPSFNTMSALEKGKLFQNKIDEINDKLKDPTNRYKSIATIVDDVNGQFGSNTGKIEITAVDDKVKKSEWIPSASMADNQIAHGIGIHPSLIGLTNEGGSLGAGSGSDQREAHNSEIDMNTLDQKSMLWPLQFIADFNKWGITYMFDNNSHTTSNLSESGIVTSPHKTEIVDE